MARVVKVAVIEIQPGNVIKDPELFVLHSDEEIVWVVVNNDNVDHWVKVDTADMIFLQDKGTTNPKPGTPPLKGGKHDVKVKPTEVDLLKGHKAWPVGTYGPGKALPYTAYGYTIVSGNDSQYNTKNQLDPGFVITPP